MRRAHRGSRMDAACFCPDHRIRVSPSRSRPTYVFQEASRNCIVDRGLLHLVTKTESWRLGNETSEDALSWNVFVGLKRLGRLRDAVSVLTGISVQAEPSLYLWGNEILEREVSRWSLLGKVRDRLEPRVGIRTEPDVALHVPGQLLVLIEAKFGSPNSTLDGKTRAYDSVQDFLRVYPAPEEGPDPLEREWIESMPTMLFLEQLSRLAVFGAWMRNGSEQVVVVNLLRKRDLLAKAPDFVSHLSSDSPVTFEARAWEQLIPLTACADGETLARYLTQKSYCLRPAFFV